MSEKHLWITTPSQLTNIGVFIRSFLIAFFIIVINCYAVNNINQSFIWGYLMLIIPFVRSLWAFMVIKYTKYELTTERFKQTTGVINLIFNELELYRIQRHILIRPWYLRLFGLGNIVLITSDKIDDIIVLKAISYSEDRYQDFREQTEICRERKVRELDLR